MDNLWSPLSPLKVPLAFVMQTSIVLSADGAIDIISAVALGLDVPKKVIDDLFSEWDSDGGGEIGYPELRKILQAPRGAAAKTQPRAKK